MAAKRSKKTVRRTARRRTRAKIKTVKPRLIKTDPAAPALMVNGRGRVGETLVPGADYGVIVDAGGRPYIERLTTLPIAAACLGGFHFAPGGNAADRSGGDIVPVVNRYSLWDINFRPACPDPRGMAVHEVAGIKCWLDIYLLGKDHLADGTSRFGVTIADGNDPPQNPAGGYFAKLDYPTAAAVMKHHGKSLASVDELRAAAHGVTERSSASRDPKITGLDAARTGCRGLMQATGNLWAWCHDGDPDQPRASLFGGSWCNGDSAGSRYASVDFWPDYSDENIGARGRGDHLQLG